MVDKVPWTSSGDWKWRSNDVNRAINRRTHRTTDLSATLFRRRRATSGWLHLLLELGIVICIFVPASEAADNVFTDSQISYARMSHQLDGAPWRTKRRSLERASVQETAGKEIACNVTFDPTEISLDENVIKDVNCTVSCEITAPPGESPSSQDDTSLDLYVSFSVLDVTIATIQGNRQFNYTISRIHKRIYHTKGNHEYVGPTYDNSNTADINISDHTDYSISEAFSVKGIQFGRTQVQTTLTFFDSTGRVANEDSTAHDLVVKKEESTISIIYLVIVGVMIVIYNFGFGCKVKAELIIAIVKRPVAPVIGLCCQFIIMSPLSFGVAKLLNLSNEAGMGLLAIGSAPGGGGSNVFAFLLKGDLELSITMTFFSTVASLGMTPLWIWALGRYFMGENTKIEIPVANVFSSLAIVTIPVILGIIVNRFKPRVARKIAWCLKPATGIIGAVFISLGVYVYYSALVRVDWETIVACIVVSFCGYAIGASAGKIFRQPRPRWLTISLETGFQNLALALMIIGTSLDPPESDLAGVVPVCYTFLSSAMPASVFIIKMIVQICRGEKPWKESDSQDITTDKQPDQDTIAGKYELDDVAENCTGVKISTISSENGTRALHVPEENGNINGPKDHGKENGSVDISPTRSYDNEVFEHV